MLSLDIAYCIASLSTILTIKLLNHRILQQYCFRSELLLRSASKKTACREYWWRPGNLEGPSNSPMVCWWHKVGIFWCNLQKRKVTHMLQVH